jgi:hypothetical protein
VCFGEAHGLADFDASDLPLSAPASQGDDGLAEVFRGLGFGIEARK